MIPSFILTLLWGICYTMCSTEDLLRYQPKWRNRQTRTTQNRVPSGNVGSIPTFGTRDYTACAATFFLKIQYGCGTL